MPNRTYHITQIANLTVERVSDTHARIAVQLEPDAIEVVEARWMTDSGFYFNMADVDGKWLVVSYVYNGRRQSLPNFFEDMDDIEEHEGDLQEIIDQALSTKDRYIANFKITGTDIVLADPMCGFRAIHVATAEFPGLSNENEFVRCVAARMYRGKAYGLEKEQAHRVCSGMKAMLKERELITDFGEISFAGVKFNGNWNML